MNFNEPKRSNDRLPGIVSRHLGSAKEHPEQSGCSFLDT
nr:MAG TPA: hypothetical protein [Caudoviricetes sp.]